MPDQPTPRSENPAAGTTAGPTPPTDAPAAPAVQQTAGPNPPTKSAAVAAETAPAQTTAGPSTDVDSVPSAPETPVYRHGMFGVTGSGDTSGFGGLLRRVPVLPGTPRPWGGWFDGLDATLTAAWPGYAAAVERAVLDRGELTFYLAVDHLLEMLRVLRDHPDLRFELLSSLSGVHYPDDPSGRPLHSVYHLTSMTYRRNLRLEVSVTDADPHVPSATSVYPTADWQERETWDMFGIIYDGHPGLTRIEMPDDWVGHPQRKDYPLGGIPVEYKGATIPPPDRRRAYQ